MMKWSDGKPYYSLNQYYRDCFGEKAYKLALNIGGTCPNRDGTLGTSGCIYCSEQGSGDFATSGHDISQQIEDAIPLVTDKYSGSTYVAYLQSFTNTYGDTAKLTELYRAILADERISGLSIGTRPDCLNDDLLDALEALSKEKPIWIELGLQTIHEESANFINRCYPLSVFNDAVRRLHARGLPIIVHLIAGLPGESSDAFLESVIYMNQLPISGIKFHLLHVLKNTDLATYYEKHPFDLPTMEGYCTLIARSIASLSPQIVIHRLTGDGPKDLLIQPQWSLDKRRVLNTIHKTLKSEDLWQGKLLT